jgi:hypothetical protein
MFLGMRDGSQWTGFIGRRMGYLIMMDVICQRVNYTRSIWFLDSAVPWSNPVYHPDLKSFSGEWTHSQCRECQDDSQHATPFCPCDSAIANPTRSTTRSNYGQRVSLYPLFQIYSVRNVARLVIIRNRTDLLLWSNSNFHRSILPPDRDAICETSVLSVENIIWIGCEALQTAKPVAPGEDSYVMGSC